MTDTFPVTLKTYHKVDGSVTITGISDCEVSKHEYGQIQERWNREAAIMSLASSSAGEGESEEAPPETAGGEAAAPVGGKKRNSPSANLRWAIESYWDAQPEEFREDFYRDILRPKWVADGEIILIDEILTPDSSRFWPADKYKAGRDQESFDKQFVRNYLESINFDKSGPGVELPEDIVTKTSAKYIEAYERLTGKEFEFSD